MAAVPLLVVVLEVLAASDPSPSLSTQAQARGEPQSHVSAQAGGGQLDGALGFLLRPRAAYVGPRFGAAVAAPLSLRVDPQGQAMFLNDWTDPGTYAGFVEELRWRSLDGGLRLRAGGRGGDSLGLGTLVDGLVSSHDPLAPRLGVSAEFATPTLAASALVADVTRPMVIAGHVEAAPLAWAGLAFGDRLWLSVSGAVDPGIDVPAGGEPGTPATALPVNGGGAVGVKALVIRQSQMALIVHSNAAFLTEGRSALHLGLALELLRDPLPGANAFSLRLEGVRAVGGYEPGLFDAAYASTRRTPTPPRAASDEAPHHWARARLDARLGAVTVAASTDVDLNGRMDLSLGARLTRQTVSAQLVVVQHEVGDDTALVSLGRDTVLAAEVAWRFFAGLFTFASVQHGPRLHRAETGHTADATRQPSPATDWLVGIGYAAGTTH